MIKSINPATEKEIKSYQEMDESQIKRIINDTNNAFLNWRNTDFSERKVKMKNVAGVLRNKKKEYAELMTLEMGKPIKQSFAEVEKCAWVCDYFADNAENFLKDQLIETDASKENDVLD